MKRVNWKDFAEKRHEHEKKPTHPVDIMQILFDDPAIFLFFSSFRVSFARNLEIRNLESVNLHTSAAR